jgi:hypothetical protein
MEGTTTAISPETHLAGDRLTGTAPSAAGVERPHLCGCLRLIAGGPFQTSSSTHVPLANPQENQ